VISGVVIEGLDEAKRKLGELHPKQMRTAERASMRAAGNVLAAAAKRRAPRRTGFLASKGIGVSVSLKGDAPVANVGANRVGRFQELGTRKMRARPFLRPALAETKDQVVETYAAAFKKRVAQLTQ